MRLELTNSLDEIPRVIAALENLGACSDAGKGVLQAGELALDELLTNIISYGYADSSRHSILVDLSIDDDVLKLVITDDGVAFNPFAQEEPQCADSLEKQGVGGVGIHLVKKLMDQCSYSREGQRNIVTISKSLV